MSLIVKILPYIEIVLGVILILAILLQQSGSNVGGALGGGDSSTFHSTRRGFEKFLFILSIVCAILFIVSALLIIVLKNQI
jgi:protein translocase SecG subunit